MTNFKQKIFLLGLMVSSTAVFSQIKEEKLVLDRKREPEVRKIEKKRTSVATVKNYPPQSKKTEDSLNLRYTIVDVPAASDFKTSTIQGEDISPKFETDYQNNYVQVGMGNFGKILADANISTVLENKMEVGADAHFLSTSGLKKDYDWDSKQSSADVGLFLTSYGEKGKFGANANYGLENYNYYGIYAFHPDADTDLKQKVNQLNFNGYYDFYSNEILNDVRFKTSFLTDHFSAKESQAEILLNLSKHSVPVPRLDQVRLNGDLGIKLETLKSDFAILNENSASFFDLSVAPKVTFYKGNSYLMLGSEFSFLNARNSNKALTEETQNNKIHWFPKAELQFAAKDEFKFYAGVDGGLKINSYANLLEENPYLVSDQELHPTETKFHAYFGMKGDINQNLKYDFNAGFAKMKNIMFFSANNLYDYNTVATRAPYDFANTFSAVYDDGTLSEVKGSVQYFPLANLILDGELHFTKYKLDTYENIYNKPLLKSSLGAKYTMFDKKLNLGAKAIFVSDRTTNSFEVLNNGINPNLYTSTEDINDKVGGFADLNLSAEYQIHKNFSIFALGNNLLNTKYQTFKGYKVLGAQILGGVKFSF